MRQGGPGEQLSEQIKARLEFLELIEFWSFPYRSTPNLGEVGPISEPTSSVFTLVVPQSCIKQSVVQFVLRGSDECTFSATALPTLRQVILCSWNTRSPLDR